MFEPFDLTPISQYEMLEWVGCEGQCSRCKKVYLIRAQHYDKAGGYCPECPDGVGWVSMPPQFNKAFLGRALYELHKSHCDKILP